MVAGLGLQHCMFLFVVARDSLWNLAVVRTLPSLLFIHVFLIYRVYCQNKDPFEREYKKTISEFW